jgi:hypothetical protein
VRVRDLEILKGILVCPVITLLDSPAVVFSCPSLLWNITFIKFKTFVEKEKEQRLLSFKVKREINVLPALRV